MTHFSSKEKVMTTHRSEKDSMGAIDVPADKLWGAQTSVLWSISASRPKK